MQLYAQILNRDEQLLGNLLMHNIDTIHFYIIKVLRNVLMNASQLVF